MGNHKRNVVSLVIDCALCGYRVTAKGMSNHQTSIRCLAGRKRREMEANGYVVVPGRRIPMWRPIAKAGLLHLEGTLYLRGHSKNARASVKVERWVQSWVLDLPIFDCQTERLAECLITDDCAQEHVWSNSLPFVAFHCKSNPEFSFRDRVILINAAKNELSRALIMEDPRTALRVIRDLHLHRPRRKASLQLPEPTCSTVERG